MNPANPADAQRIVNSYATVLERHMAEGSHPVSLAALPHPKDVIRASLVTVTKCLAAGGQLTSDLCTLLETAFVALADYVDDELARLLKEHRAASEAVAAAGEFGRDKVKPPAWQTLAATSALVSRATQAMAAEAGDLRAQFLACLQSRSETRRPGGVSGAGAHS